MKEYQLEFTLGKISELSLWKMIADNDGFSKWFADSVDVSASGEEYIFGWGETLASAILLEIKERKHIRFRWVDEDEDTFVELAIEKIALTDDLALRITDFCEEEDHQSAVSLWESQVENLKRQLGVI